MNVFDWTVLLLAGIAFIFNGANRVDFNRVWNSSKAKDVKIPETRPTYDADALMGFVSAAKGITVGSMPALEFYVKRILIASDLCFAFGLALATGFLWWKIATNPAPPFSGWGPLTASGFAMIWTWLSWAALPCGAMALIYFAADVAEDFKLAAILWHGDLWHTMKRGGAGYPEHIDRAEAAAANMLTRIKMLSLCLSVIGGLIFGIVWLIQTALEKIPASKGGPDPDKGLALKT
jgi:hypothetical protein